MQNNMTKMRSKLFLIVTLIIPFSATGELPAYIQSCFDCHGDKGVSKVAEVPTIAGLSATFIELSMYAYRDNVRPAVSSKYIQGDSKRPATDMKVISDLLSDKEIKEIASYFASQRFVAAKQPFASNLVAVGESVHFQKCRKCHENSGSLATDDAGILAGQWTSYLDQSIGFYRDGTRAMAPKMKSKIDRLSDQEWQALRAFYASKQD
jgi:cytochrome subunit of sulfide dehydrogenase